MSNPNSVNLNNLDARYSTPAQLASAAAAAQSQVAGTNTQTASYTLALSDAGKVVELNSVVSHTLTIPTNASVAFPVGTVIEIFQLGVGQTNVAGASGVTLLAPAGTKIAVQYGSVSLRQRAVDTWVVAGYSSL